jgi:hypothetical protein
MHSLARTLVMTLLACTVLLASSTFGQSVSIAPKDGTNFVVEASAPAGASYMLQASANLHLWIDIHAVGTDKYTYQFTPGDARFRYFRLLPAPPAGPDIVVLLLGDSMTADNSGWGMGFASFLKPNVTVVNYAGAWTSTKVFIASPEWDKMLLIEPNYVLIQYGFMDADDPSNRGTTPVEFEANLRTIVEGVRSFNGVPILVTVHSGRYFDAQGHVIPLQAWEGFNVLTRKVAADLHTHLIDLNKSSLELLNKLGYDGSEFMRLWPNDLMHLSQPLGSKYVGQLVVKDLPDELGSYLTGVFEPLPKP